MSAGGFGAHKGSDLGELPQAHAGDAAHDAMLIVIPGKKPGELALRVRALPPVYGACDAGDLFSGGEARAARIASDGPRWAAQARDLEVLAGAAARDRGNRGGTWTPEEVAAADRLDDAYERDDLQPLGVGELGLDGVVVATTEQDSGMTTAQQQASDKRWAARRKQGERDATRAMHEKRLAPCRPQALAVSFPGADAFDDLTDAAKETA